MVLGTAYAPEELCRPASAFDALPLRRTRLTTWPSLPGAAEQEGRRPGRKTSAEADEEGLSLRPAESFKPDRQVHDLIRPVCPCDPPHPPQPGAGGPLSSPSDPPSHPSPNPSPFRPSGRCSMGSDATHPQETGPRNTKFSLDGQVRYDKEASSDPFEWPADWSAPLANVHGGHLAHGDRASERLRPDGRSAILAGRPGAEPRVGRASGRARERRVGVLASYWHRPGLMARLRACFWGPKVAPVQVSPPAPTWVLPEGRGETSEASHHLQGVESSNMKKVFTTGQVAKIWQGRGLGPCQQVVRPGPLVRGYRFPACRTGVSPASICSGSSRNTGCRWGILRPKSIIRFWWSGPTPRCSATSASTFAKVTTSDRNRRLGLRGRHSRRKFPPRLHRHRPGRWPDRGRTDRSKPPQEPGSSDHDPRRPHQRRAHRRYLQPRVQRRLQEAVRRCSARRAGSTSHLPEEGRRALIRLPF